MYRKYKTFHVNMLWGPIKKYVDSKFVSLDSEMLKSADKINEILTDFCLIYWRKNKRLKRILGWLFLSLQIVFLIINLFS